MSVYMKLLVVISLTLTLSHVAVHSARVRRDEQRTVTEEQKSDIVNKHNQLRAQEGAADMEVMTWNESLAGAAKDWAKQCKWKHGHPPLPGTSFTDYGQNLYYTTGKISMEGGIQDWYDEKSDYDYDTLGCTAGKMCGHYTQVVWATSRQVGCAYHLCTALSGTTHKNVEYLACNYLPQGNFVGQKPFKKGPACSECGSGAGWCKDKLCNSQCSKAGTDCSCAARCYNCAKLNQETCRCTCADGWYGTDCREPCEDRNENCNPSPGESGWPPAWCNHPQHSSMVKKDCLVMCKLCKPDPNAEADKCPPKEGPGAYAPTSTASTIMVMIQPPVMMPPVVMIVIAISINSNAAL